MYRHKHSCLFLFLATCSLCVFAAEDYTRLRQDMVKAIQADFEMTKSETGRSAMDPRVEKVMGTVPRHKFVPADQIKRAYLNRPLPIGYGQTISQPYIVALMTDLADLQPDDVVLEIGTGSAYQAAVLSGLVDSVYSIEIIEELGEQAAQRLADLDYNNVTTKIADGYYGWEEHGLFDAIIVTAASSHIPRPLVKQLKPGGRMIAPVGSQFLTQYLVLVEKDTDGNVQTSQLLPVRFVPLTGEH